MKYSCEGATRNTTRVGKVLFPNSAETHIFWPINTESAIEIEKVRRIWIDICIVYNGSAPDKKLHHTKIWMASWPIQGKPIQTGKSVAPPLIYYSLPIPGWVVVKTEAD